MKELEEYNEDEAKALVSVVIVSQNRPALLKRAIESVIAQTYHPIEIVIVDNQSTPAIDWPSPDGNGASVKVIRSPFFMNTAQSRNYGVTHSTGAFVSFLDDDDFYFCEKIEKQMAEFRADLDLNIVYINTERHDKDGVRQATMRGIYTEPLVRLIHLNGLMIRRDVALKEPFDERMTRHVDDHLAFRLFDRYKWKHVDEPGAVWNDDGRSDQLTYHSATTRFRNFPAKYKNWKIMCEDFVDNIDQSAFLRKLYYRRQAILSLIMVKPIEAIKYASAAIGWSNGPR